MTCSAGDGIYIRGNSREFGMFSVVMSTVVFNDIVEMNNVYSHDD